MAKEILDKKVAIDIDSDGKSDFKLDIKSILIVGGFIVSGTMGYSNVQNEIEIAKELPVIVEKKDNSELLKQQINFMQNEINKLEDKVSELEDKVYKR